MKISNLTESLERNYLTERINHENDEINALLRQYVGKKNIPAKAKKAIEDAGISIEQNEYDSGIIFRGPNGKTLRADGRTWKSGPVPPQSEYERRIYSKYGGYDGTSWDLAKNANDYRAFERSNQLRKSWDAVDLKGYLDSDRLRKNVEDRKSIVDPSYSRVASRYQDGDMSLRPHSDPYRSLKDAEDDAISTRDFRRGYYGIKSDEEIEAEVQAFRDKLIAKNNYNKKNNQEAEDKASSASQAVDDYLRSKGVR